MNGMMMLETERPNRKAAFERWRAPDSWPPRRTAGDGLGTGRVRP
jgi:hypothetical protein